MLLYGENTALFVLIPKTKSFRKLTFLKSGKCEFNGSFTRIDG